MIRLVNILQFLFTMCIFQITFYISSNAQAIAINPSASATPNASSILDIDATDRGLLIPRMTGAQRDALNYPGDGLFIFNLTTHLLNFYFCDVGWQALNNVTNVSSTTGAIAPGGGIAFNKDGSNAANCAIVDISSTTKGFIIPQVSNTSAVTSPATGLLVHNLIKDKLSYYNGSTWVDICAAHTTNTIGTTFGATGGIKISNTVVAPASSAMLDAGVSGLNKGLLIPRMTSTQRDALNPVEGLILYNVTTNFINYWNGSNWDRIDAGTPPSAPTANAATGVGKCTYTANWSAVAGATKYSLQSSCSGSCEIDVGNVTSYALSDGCCGGTCQYIVRAYNGCWSSNSNTITVSLSACYVCGGSPCEFECCFGDKFCIPPLSECP